MSNWIKAPEVFLGKNSTDIYTAEADIMNALGMRKTAAVILMSFLFVFAVFLDISSDERIKQYLDSPSVREKSKNTEYSNVMSTKKIESPLVQQADTFSSYLNRKSKLQEAPRVPRTMNVIRRLAVTPEFKLLGTSYCKNNPKMSLALVDEPGKGQRWVRQFSEVGHFCIEQIKDGLIVVKNYEETFELAVQPSPKKRKLIIKGPLPPRERLAGNS
jgi:hypothetical protein